MTNIVVAKFGGTSVADIDAMRHSAEIVLANPEVRVVVLSASAGVTNLLVALAEGCELEKRQPLLAEIQRIQDAILGHLPQDEGLKKDLNQMLASIQTLSDTAALATSPSLADELLSYGELLSSRLFTALLHQHNANVTWFDVRQIMLTNARFGRAEPDIDILYQRAQQHLRPHLDNNIVITQGFIGQEEKGRTTTLGRGGSDYTAALLGEALHAYRVDIWTDVPGIYTIDPRIVPTARRIDEIGFSEAAEMATFGAKVLHPATLLPAIRSNIPVFVGSSRDPDAGGTRVCNKINHPPLFRALALRRKQTLMTLHSLNMLHAQGFLAEVFGILARHHLSVDLITTSEVSVALTLDTLGSHSNGASLLTPSLFAELSALCRVEVEEDLALVALIGNQFSCAQGLGKKIFEVMEPFNLRMICYGASNHNLCFLVPSDNADSIIRLLHHHLFESETTMK